MPLGALRSRSDRCVYISLINRAPLFKQPLIAHWYNIRLWCEVQSPASAMELFQKPKILFLNEDTLAIEVCSKLKSLKANQQSWKMASWKMASRKMASWKMASWKVYLI